MKIAWALFLFCSVAEASSSNTKKDGKANSGWERPRKRLQTEGKSEESSRASWLGRACQNVSTRVTRRSRAIFSPKTSDPGPVIPQSAPEDQLEHKAIRDVGDNPTVNVFGAPSDPVYDADHASTRVPSPKQPHVRFVKGSQRGGSDSDDMTAVNQRPDGGPSYSADTLSSHRPTLPQKPRERAAGLEETADANNVAEQSSFAGDQVPGQSIPPHLCEEFTAWLRDLFPSEESDN